MAKILKEKTKRPTLPKGIRIYAMSDIHGCAEQLDRMFTVIDRDLSRATSIRPIHVFLGDYIDRGPASRETIDLLARRRQQHETVFLKGNHEAFLLEVLNDPSQFLNWKHFGGMPTLVSYGMKPPFNPDPEEQIELINEFRQRIPAHQMTFFNCLRTRFVCGDFFLCSRRRAARRSLGAPARAGFTLDT